MCLFFFVGVKENAFFQFIRDEGEVGKWVLIVICSQLGDVDNMVYFRIGREVQFIGNLPDVVKNNEWSAITLRDFWRHTLVDSLLTVTL